MCGDDDDHNHLDEELFNHFINLAGKYGVIPDQNAENTPADLTNSEARRQYLEGLFRAGLTRAVNDANSIQHGERMDIVAGQAIVFARLAGILVAQFPAENNLFHTVISALMEGHKQASHSHKH